jgi:hypothetical protein
MSELIVEQIIFEYKLVSEQNKPKKLRGLFQKANAQNANGRIYTTDILKREIEKLIAPIKERKLVGQLDHPQSATIEFSKASHLISGLQFDDASGEAVGELELLSTPYGKIAESLIDANVKIGISSRGLGTVRKQDEYLVVNDDFQLITFDLVAEPSTPGAYPIPVNESILRRILSKDIRKPKDLRKAVYNFVDEYFMNNL